MSYGPLSQITYMSTAVMRPSLVNPTFMRPVQAGAGAADDLLFFAGDAHHDRRAGLLRQQSGNHQGDVAGDLATEPASCIFTDKHDIVGIMPSQRAIAGTVCAVLCVPVWTYTLPFCQ